MMTKNQYSYWIAALSLDKTSTIISGKENFSKSFKELIVETAESFQGMSGRIKLNDFWIVGKDKDT